MGLFDFGLVRETETGVVMGGLFRWDALSGLIAAFAALFFLLVLLYSVAFMRGRPGLRRYYLLYVVTFAMTAATVFADNLILFAVLWGFLGFLLYLMILQGDRERSSLTAKKNLIIVGAGDVLMVLGIALIWRLDPEASLGRLAMSTTRIELAGWPAVVAFLCLLAAALAKAGAMPFHTWVPDCAEDAPIPVTAYQPASLDKLLGIYLVARLVLDMFEMNRAMNHVLMALGAFTILAAVMMALVQHDMRRLLGYHAVSQVGYMVLGLGTGTPLGIAGALFHTLNHTIYKTALFLCAGNVEYRAGTSNLGRLGGLARSMPITFVCFLVASTAIVGLPPLNGFASKWLIFRGVIESGKDGGHLWVLWLLAAMVGTALTMANSGRLLHTVFLGRAHPRVPASCREVGAAMWLPPAVLAVLCVVFGVLALEVPLRLWIVPAVAPGIQVVGLWGAVSASLLLAAILLVFLAPWAWARFGRIRFSEPFIGGAPLPASRPMRVSGDRFSRSVEEFGVLRPIYAAAARKWFDPYELAKKVVLFSSRGLGVLHNGVMPRYFGWCLLGMAVFLLVMQSL